MRVRRAQEGNLLGSKDETHNLVTSTKSIVSVMKNKGMDVESAEILVDRAEIALSAGHYDKAKRLAEEAREELEDARHKPVSDRPVLKKAGREKKDDGIHITDEDMEEDARRRDELIEEKERIRVMPDNYLESKFEIGVAQSIVDRDGNPEAKRLLKIAKDHFDSEDYTGALKYSIRCKKAIDENEAGLLVAQKVDRKKPVEDISEEVVLAISEDEEGYECQDCGNSVKETDKFCNQCGAKIEFKPTCHHCGREVSAEDQFCSQCGANLKEIDYECPECDAKIEEDSKFCPACGVAFEE